MFAVQTEKVGNMCYVFLETNFIFSIIGLEEQDLMTPTIKQFRTVHMFCSYSYVEWKTKIVWWGHLITVRVCLSSHPHSTYKRHTDKASVHSVASCMKLDSIQWDFQICSFHNVSVIDEMHVWKIKNDVGNVGKEDGRWQEILSIFVSLCLTLHNESAIILTSKALKQGFLVIKDIFLFCSPYHIDDNL